MTTRDPIEKILAPKLLNVVFDLGGVLIAWQPESIAASLFPDPRDQALVVSRIFKSAMWRDFDAGRLDEAAAARASGLATGLPLDEMRRLFAAYKRALTPMPFTRALLDAAAAPGVDLYVLSNINADIMAHLEGRFDIWHRFRGIVTSGETGLSKPSPEIFEFLINRYGLIPGDTVIVDDTPENIAGARAVGMRGILFRSFGDCRAKLNALTRHLQNPTS
jgi:putative hydrolase of the HAD superfamily